MQVHLSGSLMGAAFANQQRVLGDPSDGWQSICPQGKDIHAFSVELGESRFLWPKLMLRNILHIITAEEYLSAAAEQIEVQPVTPVT